MIRDQTDILVIWHSNRAITQSDRSTKLLYVCCVIIICNPVHFIHFESEQSWEGSESDIRRQASTILIGTCSTRIVVGHGGGDVGITVLRRGTNGLYLVISSGRTVNEILQKQTLSMYKHGRLLEIDIVILRSKLQRI